MNRNSVLALVLLFAFLLAGCCGEVLPVTAEPTEVTPTEVPPTATPSPTPTAVPTATPTEVPTPTATPTEVVWEYDQALLDTVFADCRKFSGGPMGDQEAEEYMTVLLQGVGLDLYSPDLPPWTSGISIYGTPLLTRNQWLDPTLEYCFVVVLVDEMGISELLNDIAPAVPGLLIYENREGEFVVLKVQPALTDTISPISP